MYTKLNGGITDRVVNLKAQEGVITAIWIV